MKIIINSEYVIDSQTQVLARPGYAGINYSDGDETELRIARIIEQATDKTVLSTELRQHCTDWPSLYHLSSTRANIMRPFSESLTGDILEIGAGCGAITRYLGECGANVLALEGSPRRASIARSRTCDLDNVTVLAEKLDQFQCDHQFDVITLIGVLEYANLFMSGENPHLAMLEHVRPLLKPDGKLIIAIENQLGLKYFAGAPEDHLGQPMIGIEGRYRKDQPQTFGRKVLANMLEQAGFFTTEFLAPFPDYKLPVSIITEEGFANENFDAAAFAWQSARRDPQLPTYCNFSIELVWPEVFKNELGLDVANSFLVVASPQLKTHDNGILAYHYSTERRAEYCKETLFLCNARKDICVKTRRLNVSLPLENSEIQFHPSLESAYVHGKALSWEFIQIVTRDNWMLEEVAIFFRYYISVVLQYCANRGEELAVSENLDVTLPGFCFDLVPHNIIRRDSGEFEVIDTEWTQKENISVGELVFRSFLTLVAVPTHFSVCADAKSLTWVEFLTKIYQLLNIDISTVKYQVYGNRNERMQQHIVGSSQNGLQWLNATIPMRSSGIIGQIVDLNQAIAERDGQIVGLHDSILEIRSSTSWRATMPLRFASSVIRKVRSIFAVLPDILHKGGGFWSTLHTTARVVRNEGLEGVIIRLKSFFADKAFNSIMDSVNESQFSIVPYYIDPSLDSTSATFDSDVNIAVHLHLYYTEMLNEFASYLNNIPVQFDLYVSVPKTSDVEHIKAELKGLLPKVGSVVVEPVPNRGRDIAPLIAQFGSRLANYEIIAHIHTKKSPHSSNLAEWRQDILSKLMGAPGNSGGHVAHIIGLLQTTAKVVFPEGQGFIKSRGGWDANYELAKQVLKKYTKISIEDFPSVAFPEGAMFWARTECLKDFLGLPLSYNDFPSEPIAADGTLAHALERLILIFASKHQGQCIRIHKRDSI